MAFLHCEQAVRDDLTMALLCANQVPHSNLNARIRTLENSVEARLTEHQLEMFSPMSQEANEALENHHNKLANQTCREEVSRQR